MSKDKGISIYRGVCISSCNLNAASPKFVRIFSHILNFGNRTEKSVFLGVLMIRGLILILILSFAFAGCATITESVNGAARSIDSVF
jgi:hypothetical protein